MTLKKTLFTAALLCAGFAHAAPTDIVVTTTADEDINDKQCSLREAVALINQKLLDSKEGYHGCGGVTADVTFNSRIVLKAGSTYTLTKGSLDLTESMSIISDQSDALQPDSTMANPVITTSAVQRLFVIDDQNSVTNATKSVSFDSVDLRGCGAAQPQASSCTNDDSGNGGIIVNNENLSFNKLRISAGRANNGGAVYMSTTKNARMGFNQTIFEDNQAQQGGAIWSASPEVSVNASLLRGNKSLQVGNGTTVEPGAAVFVALGPETSLIAPSRLIAASTLSENTGYAVILRAGMSINSATIINNSVGGVYIKSNNPAAETGKPINYAQLANSLLVGNGTSAAPRDCAFDATESSSGASSYLNHLVFMGGCDQHPRLLDNTQSLTNLTILAQAEQDNSRRQDLLTLIADSDNDGVCDLPPARGLLCPLEKRVGDYVPFYRPRLLISYRTLQDSPIVNRGLDTPPASSRFLGCTGADQRGRTRVLCDIGAIELKLAESDSNSKSNFADLLTGQVARIDLSGRSTTNGSEDVLGDGELIPASLCSVVYPSAAVPTGGWLNGCVQYITPPAKGSVEINNLTNELVYTPNGNWHGEDRFSYRLTTTTTRFADAFNDQSLLVETRISQAPANTFTNYKVNLGSGALGIYSLLGLLGLAALRRHIGKGE